MADTFGVGQAMLVEAAVSYDCPPSYYHRLYVVDGVSCPTARTSLITSGGPQGTWIVS